MTDVSQAKRTLLRNSDRVNEIVSTFVKYGYSSWVVGVPDQYRNLLSGLSQPELLEMSDGERLSRACLELGVTFIKIGQVLSTRSDIVGPEVAAAMAELQGDVPPDPPEVVRETIREQLGDDVDNLVSGFEDTPLGSASVAQVHAATLHDGTEVVLKIQHQGVQDIIATDLDILEALAVLAEDADPDLALYRPVAIAAQLRRSLVAETNFLLEAANLRKFKENFAEEPDVEIPTPYPELSSERVLTMSRMAGDPLSKSIDSLGADGLAFVKRGADIYIEMIFRDGLFHADPHPGNIYVLPGNRIGLLDFGKVGRIDDDLQDVIDDVVVAALRWDVDGIVEGILSICDAPPTLDRKELRRDIVGWMDQYASAGIANTDMGGAADAADEILRRHRLFRPPDVALLVRTLVQLQGMLVETKVDITVTEVLSPYASQIAAKRFAPQRLARNIQRSARDWENLIDTFPVEVAAILEGVRKGQIDLPLNVRGLDRNVNRLVYAALSAALFSGSARLWANDVSPKVGGISLPGAVGTIAAGAFAVRLLRASKRAGGIG
ncbi:MAG: AarF/UbiB family protein [Acidimicrobiia bacterium]|nr:AarF/UbiB family protein [Acidimicrobiia bacterium]